MKFHVILALGLLLLPKVCSAQTVIVPGPPLTDRGWIATITGSYAPALSTDRITYTLQVTKDQSSELQLAWMSAMHSRVMMMNPDNTLNKVYGTDVLRIARPIADPRRLTFKLNPFSILQDVSSSMSFNSGDATSTTGALQVYVTLPTGYSVEDSSVVPVQFPDASNPQTLTDGPKVQLFLNVPVLTFTIRDSKPTVADTFEPRITHQVKFNLVQTTKAPLAKPAILLMAVTKP